MKILVISLLLLAILAITKASVTHFGPTLYTAAIPIETSHIYHNQDAIGQYSYGYSGGPSAKTEQKTLDGVTRGSYSYIDSNNHIQTVHYTADALNGFRVAATNLPIAPAVTELRRAPEPVQDTPEVVQARLDHMTAFREAEIRAAQDEQDIDENGMPIITNSNNGNNINSIPTNNNNPSSSNNNNNDDSNNNSNEEQNIDTERSTAAVAAVAAAATSTLDNNSNENLMSNSKEVTTIASASTVTMTPPILQSSPATATASQSPPPADTTVNDRLIPTIDLHDIRQVNIPSASYIHLTGPSHGYSTKIFAPSTTLIRYPWTTFQHYHHHHAIPAQPYLSSSYFLTNTATAAAATAAVGHHHSFSTKNLK